VSERLAARQIRVEIDAVAVERIIDIGFNDRSGARGIRRVIEEQVEDPLSEMIILGQVDAGKTAIVALEGDRLKIRVV